MSLEQFKIVFDNPHAVYYTGQEVRGRIVILNNLPKKVRGISVTFVGKAAASWTERRSIENPTPPNLKEKLPEIIKAAEQAENRSKFTRQDEHEPDEMQTSTAVTLSNEQSYFETKVYVLGGEDNASLTIGAGKHSFPFTFLLPKMIPSSFEGDYGHIRYTVEATMERPWKFDHRAKEAFTVISPFDLNSTTKLAEPIEETKTKKFFSFMCSGGHISINFSLPSGGAVPGETLLPTIDVENNTKVNIRLVRLKFFKIVHHTASDGSKLHHESVIAIQNAGKVDAGESKKFDQICFTLPPIPPSNLTNCRIMSIEYLLKAYFYPSAYHRSFIVTLPLVLGTIPLHRNFVQCLPSGQTMPIGWNVSPSALAYDTSSSYQELPPPSYEDSMFGTRNVVERSDNKYVFGSKTFAPKYPVYNHKLRAESEIEVSNATPSAPTLEKMF